jgi:hypothetical protein
MVSRPLTKLFGNAHKQQITTKKKGITLKSKAP